MKLALGFLVIGCAMHIQAGVYTDRFMQQYNKIKNSSNGYFSKEGVPYHSVETLAVDWSDYGHVTTSEDFSYYIWLEALHGAVNKDFDNFNKAWQLMEDQLIPKVQNYPERYDRSAAAAYMPGKNDPSEYPVSTTFNVEPGYDPLDANYYHGYEMYSTHRFLDVDNTYGFGNLQGECSLGPSKSGPSLIDTFRRGLGESIWQTIPRPTCDNLSYGGPKGFLNLFIRGSFDPQWIYTNDPSADARSIQSTFLALEWAKQAGKTSQINDTLTKASKMGSFLRYSHYDRYFRRVGNCVDIFKCALGNGKDSAHYLISMSFGWGGYISKGDTRPWRVGNSAAHFGHQNPLAAYAMSNDDALRPTDRSTTGTDWEQSLDRQLEFYKWLQTSEGAFAGGATNSWNDNYDKPPDNVTTNTFHGMFYDSQPGHHNPASNRWYGYQALSADRLAQFYYYTGNSTAKDILDKWVSWISGEIKFNGNSYQLPETLEWQGVPPEVHVSVTSRSDNVGTASATARALSYYAAKSNNQTVKDIAKKLLDGIWENQTPIGVSTEESLEAFKQFNTEVPLPEGWNGTYPNGDVLVAGSTFLQIRSWYKKDKNWPLVVKVLNGEEVPKLKYHRFWAQADVAISQGTYGLLFNE